MSQNLLTLLGVCLDFRFSSGSGTLTLYPVLAKEMNESRIVMQRIASLTEIKESGVQYREKCF